MLNSVWLLKKKWGGAIFAKIIVFGHFRLQFAPGTEIGKVYRGIKLLSNSVC